MDCVDFDVGGGIDVGDVEVGCDDVFDVFVCCKVVECEY